jgi:hypothetical protein
VAQHEGDGLRAGEAGQRVAHLPAVVERQDGVGDVGRDRQRAAGRLLVGRAPPAGAQVVQGGVRRGDRQPARRLARRYRGAAERQEDLLRHVLGLAARPSTRAATPTTRG